MTKIEKAEKLVKASTGQHSYNNFMKTNQSHVSGNQKFNSEFLVKGTMSNEISCGEITYPAAIVNKQESNKAYIYTNIDNELELGSLWKCKGLTFLIAKHIITIADTKWNKYTAYVCNLQITDEISGYIETNVQSAAKVGIEEDSFSMAMQRPVLTLPKDILTYKDKIVINDRAWVVDETLCITIDNITHCTLNPSTITKEDAAANEGKDIYIIKHQPVQMSLTKEEPVQLLRARASTSNRIKSTLNQTITLATEDGYFKTSSNVKIVKRTAKSISFNIPFGTIDNITITTKQNGEFIETIVEV